MSMEDLIESGRSCDISERTICRLCQEFTAAQVDDGLALLYIEQRRIEIRNPTGWLRAAIQRRFTTPRRSRYDSKDIRQKRREIGERRAARLVEHYRQLDEAEMNARLIRQPVTENPWFAHLPVAVQQRLRR